MSAEHQGVRFPCTKCAKEFKYARNQRHHELTCQGNTEHVCSLCQKLCATAHGLRRHLQWHEKAPVKRKVSAQPSTPPTKRSKTLENIGSPGASNRQNGAPSSQMYRCRRCTSSFENRHDLYLHGMRKHYQQVGGALQLRPWDENNAPWMRDGEDDGLREVYEANEPHILQTHDRGPIRSVYNFPLDNDVNINQLLDFATEIYNREQRAFRLNLVFGVILQHRETGQYRYFVPYNNNGIFERPFYVSKRSDLNHLRNRLRRLEITTELLRIRPDTKWIPVLVTNVHFTVHSTNYPLGQGQLPEYLLRKDSVYPLVKNQQNGKLYDDNLCAFRCLALHRGHEIRCIDGPAQQLYRQWSQEPADTFQGLSFEDFPEFESRFRVNLEVYSLEEDGFARSIYKSRGLQETTMYVNMYENHLSFIKNFATYAQKYRCKTCD